MNIEIIFETVEHVLIQLLLGAADVLKPDFVERQFLTYSVDVFERPAWKGAGDASQIRLQTTSTIQFGAKGTFLDGLAHYIFAKCALYYFFQVMPKANVYVFDRKLLLSLWQLFEQCLLENLEAESGDIQHVLLVNVGPSTEIDGQKFIVKSARIANLFGVLIDRQIRTTASI